MNPIKSKNMTSATFQINQVPVVQTSKTTQEDQTQTTQTWITLACLAFFPVAYLIGSTLMNWMGA